MSQDPSNPYRVVVDGETLQPKAGTIIGDTPVYLDTGAPMIGGGAESSTLFLPAPTKMAGQLEAPIITVAGQIVSFDPANSGVVMVAGQKIPYGDSAITLYGTPVSVGPGASLFAGPNAVAMPTGLSLPAAISALPPVGTTVATVGRLVILVDPTDPAAVVVAGQTISPGGSATIDGVVISLSAGNLFVGASSIALPTRSSAVSGVVLTVGSDTIAAYDVTGNLVLGSATLKPGAPPMTMSGQAISAYSAGVVIDSSTIVYSDITPTRNAVQAVFAVGGQLFAASQLSHPSNVVRIGAATLSVGGAPATVNGAVVSVASGGVVVGGKTVSMSTVASATQGASGSPVTSRLGSGPSSAATLGVFEGAAPAKAVAGRGWWLLLIFAALLTGGAAVWL